jgi:hypothetical protein
MQVPAEQSVLRLASVPLVHSTRFAEPLETINDLVHADHHWHLVRGEILPLLPVGAATVELPYSLDSAAAVLARIDLEELAPLSRPRLTTIERGRDFYIADARGGNGDGAGIALVSLTDDAGRVHPDVELHLAAPFAEYPLPSPLRDVRHTAYLRTLAVGDPVYVLGRAELTTHAELAGLRSSPLTPTFTGRNGPIHIYDQRAFEQLAAWCALPWYKKLSVLIRSR